jgi:ubiquinone/menaquinone biosynthesis C-methylase UbiE
MSSWIVANIITPSKILDIGYGAGSLSGHEVTVFSPAHPTDVYCLPYPDQTFDVACATGIFEQIAEPYLLFAEASRVLKPQGRFFFSTFQRIHPDELEEICKIYDLSIETLLAKHPLQGIANKDICIPKFFEYTVEKKESYGANPSERQTSSNSGQSSGPEKQSS